MTGSATLILGNTEGGSDALGESVVIEAVGRALKIYQDNLSYGDGPLMPPKSVEHRYLPYFLALLNSDTADKIVRNTLGFIHTINIASTTMAGTNMALTVYDNSAGSGNILAVIDPIVRGSYLLDVECPNGITLKLSGTGSAGTANISMSYR